MEHFSSAEPFRPWRTATLVASAVAALELVLLVVAGFALFARPLARHAKHAAPAAADSHVRVKQRTAPRPVEPARHAPTLSRSRTSVLVLNGNGVAGAAGTTAARARSLGYPVTSVSNAARTDYPASLVMYRPRFRAEALRLAQDLSVRVVGPLDGMTPGDLHGAKLAFVVGAR